MVENSLKSARECVSDTVKVIWVDDDFISEERVGELARKNVEVVAAITTVAKAQVLFERLNTIDALGTVGYIDDEGNEVVVDAVIVDGAIKGEGSYLGSGGDDVAEGSYLARLLRQRFLQHKSPLRVVGFTGSGDNIRGADVTVRKREIDPLARIIQVVVWADSYEYLLQLSEGKKAGISR